MFVLTLSWSTMVTDLAIVCVFCLMDVASAVRILFWLCSNPLKLILSPGDSISVCLSSRLNFSSRLFVF